MCCSTSFVVFIAEAVLRGNNEGDLCLVNDLARMLVPAFLSIAPCGQHEGYTNCVFCKISYGIVFIHSGEEWSITYQ
jgi:hypothetical protein